MGAPQQIAFGLYRSIPEERLQAIADELARGGSPESVTVRTFLSWFGAFRRGYWIVRRIRGAL